MWLTELVDLAKWEIKKKKVLMGIEPVMISWLLSFLEMNKVIFQVKFPMTVEVIEMKCNDFLKNRSFSYLILECENTLGI